MQKHIYHFWHFRPPSYGCIYESIVRLYEINGNVSFEGDVNYCSQWKYGYLFISLLKMS